MHDRRVAEILSAVERRGGERVTLPARLCLEGLSVLPVSGIGVWR
ncbi:hypothetical protein [Actinocrispum sp. NPDC049592]